ncbi:hypothetical protein PF005_g20839 [Phytophthora fragariae]|uniref:Bifunctional inhibitor/plant lipid transfer protein/seed storage helical domain-containing protein n=1 Tax=Phytophthora fragariae TaxID=53985 RepID=A0A6A3WRF0_9STRA|nr:hypothetical protein PF003_g12216 [Phytophthora fragariae]KAE8927962.1 hypothetical protein PF009_g21881 [Phytophthora fragariae]KAE8987651.1 hypothetical protein PF011_g19497 [Phytophthora fragariae]KAE9089411.1 hypothetical protein PF007_g19613 [Phytophthora fragariae]KAE9089625.1 hypothetical protein PF010_g18918 [Phytophthora fragariae]
MQSTHLCAVWSQVCAVACPTPAAVKSASSSSCICSDLVALIGYTIDLLRFGLASSCCEFPK